MLVSTTLGFYRQTKYGMREIQWSQVNMVVFRRIMQDSIKMNFIHFGHRANVSRHGMSNRYMLLT